MFSFHQPLYSDGNICILVDIQTVKDIILRNLYMSILVHT